MPWGRNLGGAEYPPESTGSNQSQTQVATVQNNTQDSDPGASIDTFGEALQSGMSFPNSIYDTGNLDIDLNRIGFTNNSGKPFSFEIEVGGTIQSSSGVNSAIIGVRLNSSGDLGTGTLRKLPSGLTTGQLSIDTGFSTKGAFTIADGESVWLEVSKSVAGTLIVGSALCFIRPVW